MDQSVATASLDDLATKYGKAVPPAYFDNIEKFKFPDSRQLLEASSAAHLRSYLDSARHGLLVPQIVHQSAIILWLIDESGSCWFCIEEMYKADSNNTVFPRLNEIDYPKGYEKLGHPSLVSAKKARIGGEIVWSSGADGHGPRWRLSNKSGRYGIRADISRDNLNNACELFEKLGVSLDPYFIEYEE